MISPVDYNRRRYIDHMGEGSRIDDNDTFYKKNSIIIFIFFKVLNQKGIEKQKCSMEWRAA
jgi:hypothetical protein